jgi:hypothetical protein
MIDADLFREGQWVYNKINPMESSGDGTSSVISDSGGVRIIGGCNKVSK